MVEKMRKTFSITNEDGNEISLAIVQPKQSVVNEAELIYSSHYAKAISRGVPTNAQARLMIEDNNLWTEKDEKTIKDILFQITKREKKLKSNSLADEDSVKMCEELSNLRTKMSLIESKRNNLFFRTAEMLADGIRLGFLASECTVYSDSNEKYYKDYEEYLENVNPNTMVINLNAYNFFNGLDMAEKKEDVEIEILRKKNRIDEYGHRKDESGKIVDKEGRQIDEHGNYIIEINGESHLADMFGNPIDENGEVDIELDKKVHPEDYE